MEATLHHYLVLWMQFVLDYGYVGVFVMMVFESTAIPIPAEVVIPPAAYWASQGKLSIVGVVLAATAGGWVGSALSYWLSWKLGRPLVMRYGRFVLLTPHKIDVLDQWFATYGAGGIFVARLLPGIRHLISIPAGLFKMNFKTFSLTTILGAGIFCSVLAWWSMGVLGDQPALLHDPKALTAALGAKKFWLIGFALVIGALYGLMTWMQRRAASIRAAQ
jgi:membrane protein DedA with SNARE-associated domain